MYGNLTNLFLRSLVEAQDDDAEKKKKEDEEEKKRQQQEQKEQEEKNEQQRDEPDQDEGVARSGNDGESSAEEGDTGDAGGVDDGAEEGEQTDGDGAPADDAGTDADMGEGDVGDGEDFDVDSVEDVDGSTGDSTGLDDGMDGEPDGLTSPDDDGMDNSNDPDGETNIQVNILQLSKLDRALAKRRCFDYFASLRSTIETTLNILDRNETVLDAEVRTQAIADLHDYAGKIQTYLQFKFPTVNYEEGLNAYYTFVQEVNRVVAMVQQNGITSTGRRKDNKSTEDDRTSK